MAHNLHRPWPVPDRPWIMKQVWQDVLFLHYPVSAEAVKPFIPPPLELDTFDDSAWITIVPYWMTGLRLRFTPPMPFISQFPGLNVRTYVTNGGKPGVFFFSLDAHTRPGVFFARHFYKLPYYYADMKMRSNDRDVTFASRRDDFVFEAGYSPHSEEFQTEKGTLDYFLVERYCLYSERRGSVYISEINHQPWKLHEVSYKITKNTMLHQPKIDLYEPTLAHYGKSIDVHVWPVEQIR